MSRIFELPEVLKFLKIGKSGVYHVYRVYRDLCLICVLTLSKWHYLRRWTQICGCWEAVGGLSRVPGIRFWADVNRAVYVPKLLQTKHLSKEMCEMYCIHRLF